ncbi:MAG: hypothetical protein ACJ72J_08425 [Nitrososphaeraceae archaeon]
MFSDVDIGAKKTGAQHCEELSGPGGSEEPVEADDGGSKLVLAPPP